MNRFFHRFSLYELVIMAGMAVLGIALKQVVSPLAMIVAGPLMMPKGALVGGLFMMWLIIGYGIVKKPGTALIISVIQAFLVIFIGVAGSHGIMSLFTYLSPGLAVELFMLLIHHRCCCVGCCALGCLVANVAGTACVNVVFFQAPGVYLVLILSLAALSGLIGGVIGWQILKPINRYNLAARGKGGSHKWKEE